MNRRNFVWTSSISTMALFFPFTSCNGHNSELNDVLSLPITLSYIFNKEKIRELGNLYISKSKIKSDKKHLKELLLEDIEKKDDTNLSQDNSSYILNGLIQKIKNDFKINRTIELNGWILSVTEAQQCAFLFLTNN